MATHYRTQGFVFKKENRAEASKVFSVFTQDYGRMEIFAKSIRKIDSKLKSGIEIFSLSDLEFIQGKNKKTLTDAVFLHQLKQTPWLPERIYLANRVSQVLDDFIKGQEKDQTIWDLLIDFCQKLSDTEQSLGFALVYYYFFWNFIDTLGYGPELHRCAVCSLGLVPRNLYFSHKEGGVICQNCFAVKKDGATIAPDTVKILRLILKKEWDTFSKLKIGAGVQKSLKEISENYYQYLNT